MKNLWNFLKYFGISTIILFLIYSMIKIEISTKNNTNSKEIYKISIDYNKNTYTYYCSDYLINPMTNVLSMSNYKKEIIGQLIITQSMFLRIILNPGYKKLEFKETKIETKL